MRQFFACYFHEDWPVEHATPAEVLDHFVEEAGAAAAADISQLIVALLREQPGEEMLREVLLVRLGCSYDPPDGGVRAWLGEVASHLRRVG